MVFLKKADAERAMQRYNNVSLDGKAMRIELVAPTLAGRVVETLSSGLRCAPLAVASSSMQSCEQCRPSSPCRPNGAGSRVLCCAAHDDDRV